MRVTWHPLARAELIEAARFYSARNPQLGSDFLDGMDAAALTVGEDPLRHREIEPGVRRYHAPRFPYALYYEILPDRVRILAAKHHSRDEGFWRGRQED